MKGSQDFDFSTSPSFAELKAFVKRHLSLSAEEATPQQSDFERGLQELTVSLERELHTVDLERFDVDVGGIVLGC